MITAHRGRVLHCLRDPGDSAEHCEYFDDGLLLVRDGVIERAVPYTRDAVGDDIRIVDHDGSWILPGFVDCHVHYPQLDVIASYGEQLLDWLETYTYPAEERFADADLAVDAAAFFLDELLRHGTTTALVFATVHAVSAEALFAAAERRGMRLATGKTLMDRNCPVTLRDDEGGGYAQSRALIERWHGRGRLQYAITPRFAPTSSDAQLERAGALAREFSNVLIHTHLAETKRETAWVAELFPQSRSYLDVYDQAGLVRERSVFAHCLHLDDTDLGRIASTGAAMAFCPSSNLFLGSGLFDLSRARAAGARVGLGTDVGAGTSLSLLRTINDAYKVGQLRGQPLSPWRAFYLATLGGAQALRVDDRIGNFAPGKEADFIVVDARATPLSARRTRAAARPWEELFALMILGDDRHVRATYVAGHPWRGQR